MNHRRWIGSTVGMVGGMVGVVIGMCPIGGCSVAPVSFTQPSTGSLEWPLAGTYEIGVHSYLIGSFYGRIAAKPSEDGSGFIANSRPNVAWSMVGGLESAVGRLMMPTLFPGGAILLWENRLPSVDAKGQPTAGEGEFGAGKEFSLKSTIVSPDDPITLSYQGRQLGLLTIRKLEASELAAPLRTDYTALADRIAQAMRANLFDPSLAQSSQVNDYLGRIRSSAARSQDDIEFGFGANVAWRKTLNFSQTGVLRQLDSGIAERLGDGPSLERSLLRCSFNVPSGDKITNEPPGGLPRMATLQANWFMSTDDVDRMMRQATQTREIDGLCIDLRSCFGGNMTALRVISWLITEPVEVGVVYSASARERVLAGDLDGLPRLDATALGWANEMGVSTEATEDKLRQLVGPAGAFVIRVEPVDTPYTGPVCVLTSRRTGGPGEALALSLKEIKRATLIGSQTGGRMLVPRRVDVGEGWILQVAAYDYRSMSGVRPEGKGVAPDVLKSSGSAPGESVRWIRAQMARPASEADQRPESADN